MKVCEICGRCCIRVEPNNNHSFMPCVSKEIQFGTPPPSKIPLPPKAVNKNDMRLTILEAKIKGLMDALRETLDEWAKLRDERT